MTSDELPELSKAELDEVIDRAVQSAAEDSETIERALQSIADAIDEDAGPDDLIELALTAVAPLPPSAGADFVMGVAVRVIGDPPDDSDDPVLQDWISTLPVDSWARIDEEDDEPLIRGVWVEFVEPWLFRHGIRTNWEQGVMGECCVEFARRDWR